MQRVSTFTSYSFLSAALCGGFWTLSACQDLSGQCSNRTDTLCLELTVAPATTVPSDVTLTLASDTQNQIYPLGNLAAVLAVRPYVVEVGFGSPMPETLTVSATGSGTEPATQQPIQVAAAPFQVRPASAARPTNVLLAKTNGGGNDMGSPTDDMTGGMPTDMRGSPSAWTPIYTSAGNPLNGLFGSTAGGTTIYAVGNNGVVVKGDGATFSAVASAGTGTLSGIWVADAMTAFACDQSGKAYNTLNAGSTWTPSAAAGFALRGIYGRSTTDVLAVGASSSQIMHWNGSTWATGSQTIGAMLTAVFGSASNYYAIGNTGLGGRSANVTTWTALTNGSNASAQWAIAGLGTTDNFTVAVSGSGAVQSLMNASATMWTNMNFPVTTALNAVWVSAANNAIVGGAGGTVYQYSGGTWNSIGNSNLNGYTITGLWGDGSTGLWATASNGTNGVIFKR